jgi:hypothetical protein
LAKWKPVVVFTTAVFMELTRKDLTQLILKNRKNRKWSLATKTSRELGL